MQCEIVRARLGWSTPASRFSSYVYPRHDAFGCTDSGNFQNDGLVDVQSDAVGEHGADGVPPADFAAMVRIVERCVACTAIIFDIQRSSLANAQSGPCVAPPLTVTARTRRPDEAIERERNAIGADESSGECHAGQDEPATKCASFVDVIILTNRRF